MSLSSIAIVVTLAAVFLGAILLAPILAFPLILLVVLAVKFGIRDVPAASRSGIGRSLVMVVMAAVIALAILYPPLGRRGRVTRLDPESRRLASFMMAGGLGATFLGWLGWRAWSRRQRRRGDGDDS